MPKYLGKGPTFYLVRCELMPVQGTRKQELEKFHGEVCEKCGFWNDTVKRQEKAVRLNKDWRKLVCFHPSDKATFLKWKSHVTVWGK